MKVELGAPAILHQDDPGIWHLPKTGKKTLEHITLTVDDALAGHAATWPTLCTHVPGDLFVYGGFIRRRRLCPGCAFLNRGQDHDMPPGEAAAADEYDRLAAELNANIEPLAA